MTWLFFTLAASAAPPQFNADVPADAITARRAWEAAVLCTGWEPSSYPEVEITRGSLRNGLLGLAWHDDKGLYRIELDANPERYTEVIVHEVAHAWVRKGPPALVEGRTELLADCIAQEQPGIAPLQWDDGRDLVTMPSLKQWTNEDDHGPSVRASVRTDAYVGASRFVRAASLLLPAQALWPEDDDLDWGDFEALLTETGELGQPFLDLLAADAEVQREGLSDADRDGLPLVAEGLFQTHPRQWDSDGDGWWDGAAVPGGVIPLPFDGTPTCSGWATAAPAQVSLRIGGNLRGSPAPVPRIHVGGAVLSGRTVDIPANRSVLLQLRHGAQVVSGGLWAQVSGDHLVPDEACIQDERQTVWADAPELRSRMAAFAHALRWAREHADRTLKPQPLRLAVSVGGKVTTMEDDVVHIASHEFEEAYAEGKLRELAVQTVAFHRVWTQSTQVRDWRDVEALKAHLLRAVN